MTATKSTQNITGNITPANSKCLLCFSDQVFETDNEHYPFACIDCGAWGTSIDDISNLDESEADYRHGQVCRKPRAA